ncbi:MAG: radical SAM protein, partial [bacterium]
MPTVSLISLGCAKNLIDAEQMLSLLDGAGYTLTEDPAEADYAIVNTCAFIEAAQSEAIEQILRMAAYKETGRLRKLVVTGCLAQRYQEELLRELPEVDCAVGTGSVGEILKALADDGARLYMGDINAPLSEEERVVSTGPSWAYIKVAEGCSHNCAYCVIPTLRGKYRSRPMENILLEAKALAKSGVKELIVVAQDPTLYGVDLYHKMMLPELVRRLCAVEGIEWVRLHYLYPDAVTEELMEV